MRRFLTRVSTHSRPKAAGPAMLTAWGAALFQHTAARRRLASAATQAQAAYTSFNTQPPEGGWAI